MRGASWYRVDEYPHAIVSLRVICTERQSSDRGRARVFLCLCERCADVAVTSLGQYVCRSFDLGTQTRQLSMSLQHLVSVSAHLGDVKRMSCAQKNSSSVGLVILCVNNECVRAFLIVICLVCTVLTLCLFAQNNHRYANHFSLVFLRSLNMGYEFCERACYAQVMSMSGL